MSETNTTPSPGEGEPAPAPDPAATPAPATDSGEPTPSPESTPEQEQKPKREADEEGRRVAALRARLGAAEREREAQRAELEFYRRQAAQQPRAEETPEQAAMRLRAEVRGEVEAQIRTETFHAQGANQYPDWRQRCDDLMKMGADAGFAQLLVEMPEGTKVAAALAEDPAAVERIASLRSERARAVALGKYAATIEDTPGSSPGRPAPATPRPVTSAPAPIRPVTGRAAPQLNEYTMSAQQLADHYFKQNLERQKRH